MRTTSRIVATLALLTGLTVASTLISSSANAATPRPSAPASDPAEHSVTVGMYVITDAPARKGVADGAGPVTVGDCGTAQLIVNANTHRFAIKLASTKGVIQDGYYTIGTDGFGSVTQVGFVSAPGSTTSTTLGTIALPGIFISYAKADGVVITSQAACGFFAVAPWN